MILAVFNCTETVVHLIEKKINNECSKLKTQLFKTNEWPGINEIYNNKLSILKQDLEKLESII